MSNYKSNWQRYERQRLVKIYSTQFYNGNNIKLKKFYQIKLFIFNINLSSLNIFTKDNGTK